MHVAYSSRQRTLFTKEEEDVSPEPTRACRPLDDVIISIAAWLDKVAESQRISDGEHCILWTRGKGGGQLGE